MKKRDVIFVAHCILNQNTVVNGLERSASFFRNVIELIGKYDVGIEQLPCPEMLFKGLDRPSLTLKDYDVQKYHELCFKEATIIHQHMNAFQKNDYHIVGVIGIHDSPSCSCDKPVGHFMRALLKNHPYPVIQIPINYSECTEEKTDYFLKEFDRFLMRNTKQ